MKANFIVASVVLALMAVSAFALGEATSAQIISAKSLWQKEYNPSAAPVIATNTESTTVRAVPADTVIRARLRPMTPQRRHIPPPVNTTHGYIPGDYSREGFITEYGNWWIGNQPFLPYYGYNPPTINGYYPPYAYHFQTHGYGYPSNFSPIVPAPPLASPPAYIPTFTIPVGPPPLSIRQTPNGFVTQRDPHFQLYFVPQPPSYLTNGSAIYQTPSQFYPPYYPPYSYPY